MGKGHRRRPCQVSHEKYACNYDRIFKGVEPIVPTATATAIVKRSETGLRAIKEFFPKYLPGVDLTKMDHPTACKYLLPGMKVRLVCWAESNKRGWDNVWMPDIMNKYVGGVYIVETVFLSKGVSFREIEGRYPAFCLQIIDTESDDE